MAKEGRKGRWALAEWKDDGREARARRLVPGFELCGEIWEW